MRPLKGTSSFATSHQGFPPRAENAMEGLRCNEEALLLDAFGSLL